jgi:hypothetical protein
MGQIVKAVACIRRRADLPAEEFTRYWLENHSDLIKSVAPTRKMRRYVQSHTVPGPLTDGFTSSRQAAEPFDGIAEVWFDIDDLNTKPTPELHSCRSIVLADEGQFIDLERSMFFFTIEHEFVADAS